MAVKDAKNDKLGVFDAKEYQPFAVSDAADAMPEVFLGNASQPQLSYGMNFSANVSREAISRGQILICNEGVILGDIKPGCSGPNGAARFNDQSPFFAAPIKRECP